MKKIFILCLITTILFSTTINGVESTNSTSSKVSTMTVGEILNELGIITGDENGNLKENEEITRAEMITIIYRMSIHSSENPSYGYEPIFSDVSWDHWAYTYIRYAYENDITKGIGNGLFGVNEPVTYQQALAFLLRVLGEEVDYNNVDVYAKTKYNLAIDGLEKTDNIKRGDLFTLMVDTLLLEATDGKVLIDKLGIYNNAAKEVFKLRMAGEEEPTISASVIDYPEIKKLDMKPEEFPGVNIRNYESRKAYEEKGPVIIKAIEGKKFTLLDGMEEVLEFFPDDKFECFSIEGSVKSEYGYDVNKKYVYYNKEDKTATIDIYSTFGKGHTFVKNIKCFKGENVKYEGSTVTPYVIIGDEDGFSYYRTYYSIILVKDNKVVEGIVLSEGDDTIINKIEY